MYTSPSGAAVISFVFWGDLQGEHRPARPFAILRRSFAHSLWRRYKLRFDLRTPVTQGDGQRDGFRPLKLDPLIPHHR